MDSGDGEVWDVVDQGGDDCDCHVADDDEGVCRDDGADGKDLVSHVVGGQHGQELAEEDGSKEQSEDPL